MVAISDLSNPILWSDNLTGGWLFIPMDELTHVFFFVSFFFFFGLIYMILLFVLKCHD